MAAEGYRIVAEAGVDAIRAKSRRQVARLLDGFQAQGAVVRGPADPAAGAAAWWSTSTAPSGSPTS